WAILVPQFRLHSLLGMRLTKAPSNPHLPTSQALSTGRRTLMRKTTAKLAAVAVVLTCTGGAPSAAEPTKGAAANANCQNTSSFERWLAAFRQEAASSGIS